MPSPDLVPAPGVPPPAAAPGPAPPALGASEVTGSGQPTREISRSRGAAQRVGDMRTPDRRKTAVCTTAPHIRQPGGGEVPPPTRARPRKATRQHAQSVNSTSTPSVRTPPAARVARPAAASAAALPRRRRRRRRRSTARRSRRRRRRSPRCGGARRGRRAPVACFLPPPPARPPPHCAAGGPRPASLSSTLRLFCNVVSVKGTANTTNALLRAANTRGAITHSGHVFRPR